MNDEKYYYLDKEIKIKGEFKEAGLRVTNRATGKYEFFFINEDGFIE